MHWARLCPFPFLWNLWISLSPKLWAICSQITCVNILIGHNQSCRGHIGLYFLYSNFHPNLHRFCLNFIWILAQNTEFTVSPDFHWAPPIILLWAQFKYLWYICLSHFLVSYVVSLYSSYFPLSFGTFVFHTLLTKKLLNLQPKFGLFHCIQGLKIIFCSSPKSDIFILLGWLNSYSKSLYFVPNFLSCFTTCFKLHLWFLPKFRSLSGNQICISQVWLLGHNSNHFK